MSFLDKMIAAVTPPESDEARAEARERAMAASKPGDWLSMVLSHHAQLEEAFADVRKARTAAERRTAEKDLGFLLNGHVVAEEVVLYPALALESEKGHATKGYTEQAAVKIQMAALERLSPMTQDYLDKLEHIRGAVLHHMYEEESSWFLELREKASAADQAKLTERYKEEFERYTGVEAALAV